MVKENYTKETMLVVVKGEKSDEKDVFIDEMITDIQDNCNINCLHSDIDKLSQCFEIKRSHLFKRQRTILEQVANLGDVNIIVNVVNCYEKKWKKIADKFDLGFSIVDFISDKDKERQLTMELLGDRIALLEKQIEIDKS